jgi:hypothetical protein
MKRREGKRLPRWIVRALIGAMLVSARLEAAAETPRGDEAVKRATGLSLQGDVANALKALEAVPAAELGTEDQAFHACMFGRFGMDAAPARVDDSQSRQDQILAAYRRYWWLSLRVPSQRSAFELELRRDLQSVIGARDASEWDALEPRVRERMEAAGYRVLLGQTGVLRELMAWRKEARRSYQVQLPEGEQLTPVVILSDFASLGWGDYATCGRRGAGGWALADVLYAVSPRYRSLDDEEFRVSFLGHETQHFVDLRRFRKMEPWELEYRAKLVELAQADRTLPRVLAKFIEDQGDDPASPHSYANRRVLEALTKKLALSEVTQILHVDRTLRQAAAVELLKEDSAGR